jgi:[protein-PII] uridylyltransferase
MKHYYTGELNLWFKEMKSGLLLAERFSKRIDQFVCSIFDSVDKEMKAALIATGGYGRNELCPYSDIDIMFFAPDRADTASVEKMLYRLWDTGFEISHSFRTPRECIEEAFKDMRTRTSLLEARYIAGDKKLYEMFRAKVYPEIAYRKQKDFVREKLLEMEKRHLASGDSVFMLEPHIKEGEGGLRDVHTSYWLSKVALKIEEFPGLSKLMSGHEYKRFIGAYDFLLRSRFALHLESMRKNDLLSFEYQKNVAGRLGFRDSARFTATERFMRYYHLKSKIIKDTTRRIMADCSRSYVPFYRDWRVKKLSDEFSLSGGKIVVTKEGLFRRNPEKIVEAFFLFSKTGRKFSASTREKICSGLIRIAQKTRQSPIAVNHFLEILKGERVYETLREMHETGVLGRFIPEFGALGLLVVHEPYHMYTVDEHTLLAIRNLERLRATKYKNLEDFHTLVKEIGRIDTLFMAILFHDIGKAAGRHHEEEGYKRLKRIMERFNFDVKKRTRIEFLVKNHILMSRTALRMEPSDSEVVAMFADAVGDAENLKAIYLITYADMSAVNPGFWNSWKAYLLKELYSHTLAYLSGMREGREEYLNGLRDLCPPNELPGLMEFIGEMPERYLLATTRAKVIEDYPLVREMKRNGFSMRIDIGSHEVAELSISAEDRTGLFSRIVGFLASKGLNIVNGRIFTGGNGIVIDKISVSNWKDIWWEGLEEDLGRGLRDVIVAGKPFFVEGRRLKVGSPFDIFIELDNEASEEFSLIEIFSPDRLGLLYDIANVLYGLGVDIISARINTESGLAQDIFHVQAEKAKIDYRKAREILSELWTTLKGTA